MGAKSDQIVTEIDAQRSRLGKNLVELESRLRDVADWRAHYEKHPFAFTGLAFGAGLLVGAWVRGNRRAPLYGNIPAVYEKQASGAMDHIKGAIIALGMMALREFVSQKLQALEPRVRAAAGQAGQPSRPS